MGKGKQKFFVAVGILSPRYAVTELKTLIFLSNSLLSHTVWMKTKEFIYSATRDDTIYHWL